MEKSPLWTGTKIKSSHSKETQAHSHPEAQIFCVESGFVNIRTDSGSWIIPAGTVCWVQGKVKHAASLLGQTTGWVVYCTHTDLFHEKICILRSSPLLVALLERVAELGKVVPTSVFGKSLIILLKQEMIQAKVESFGLAMPISKKLLKMAEEIIQAGPGTKTVNDWAKSVGMSSRNFYRHFFKETGCSFNRWRISAGHRKAIELIATGSSISDAGERVGYDSTSAFIASFRREFGTSPMKFIRNTAGK